jgi:hypothetical protein
LIKLEVMIDEFGMLSVLGGVDILLSGMFQSPACNVDSADQLIVDLEARRNINVLGRMELNANAEKAEYEYWKKIGADGQCNGINKKRQEMINLRLELQKQLQSFDQSDNNHLKQANRNLEQYTVLLEISK